MLITLIHQVEVPSIQKATALRDKCAALLQEEDDATLIVTSHSRNLQDYKVTGVNVQTREVFTETVEAEDEDDARERAKKRNRVVTTVQPA